jgi:ABC-type transporter MlaC component
MGQVNQINPQDPIKNNSPKKNGSIVYWVVILILLAGCIYLFMSKSQMAEQNATVQQQSKQSFDSLSTEQATLKADFDAASVRIDQLVSENTKLDSALQNSKTAMSKLQSQIRGILNKKNATQAELEQAKLLIASLSDKTKEYESRIAELEQANTILTGENKLLTKERDSTVTQNIAIKQLASVLHASNIQLEAVRLKRNGKEKETSKARKADVLRMSFDIDENRIAESGSKLLHIRIMAPDGTTLNSAANGSGMITTAKGDHLSYTLSKSISLTQNQKVAGITADWNQNGDYTKGVYTIEIYHEGYSIGTGQVTLK